MLQFYFPFFFLIKELRAKTKQFQSLDCKMPTLFFYSYPQVIHLFFIHNRFTFKIILPLNRMKNSPILLLLISVSIFVVFIHENTKFTSKQSLALNFNRSHVLCSMYVSVRMVLNVTDVNQCN